MSHRHRAGLLLYAGFRLPSQIPLYVRFSGHSLTAPDDATADMVVHRHLLAAELLRIHLQPHNGRVRVALFHIDDFGV